jgi:iron-sulfur cluster assembly protein
VKELSLPPVKIHCSVLAEDAIRAAIGDWKKKNGVANGGRPRLQRTKRLPLSCGGAVRPAFRARKGKMKEKASMSNMVTIESKPAKAPLRGRSRRPQDRPPQAELAPPQRGGAAGDRARHQAHSAAMAKEGVSPEEGGLRLGVMGGGCSGLSYSIKFDTRPRERDRIYEFDGVRVFVDPKSFLYLHGMTLDYEETLMRQGFNFINPNSTRSCGCGSSFS